MSAVSLPATGVPSPSVSKSSDIGLKTVLAGLSNCFAAGFTNPADIVKVRQQLESKSNKSSPFFSLLFRMVREEGPFALWKGVSASFLREFSYSGIRMGCYDFAKMGITSLLPIGVSKDSNSLALKLSAGMASGMLGAAIANPADLFKVRMQAPAINGAPVLNLRQQIHRVYTEGGIRSMYRAVFPTTVRAGLLTSSQLGTYDFTKHELLQTVPGFFKEDFKTHLLCSAIAGFVCSLASAPVDTIKVRLMADKERQFQSSFHAASVLVTREGPLALYKGFFGCWIRLFPHTVLSLVAFERLRDMAGLRPI
ncbi:mitochondrial carrier [Atractiella rhizophila]|nr:mitochondrial carrier [Atractiella rhizophila]